MTTPPHILGIIGARSGSKSVPDKNIRPLGGVPLLGRLVLKARRSRYLTRLIVSTDSKQYAEIARSFGADVPFLRPPEISGDKATDFEYVEHTVRWLSEHEGYKPDIVVRMMCTLPFQITGDIDGVVETLVKDPTAQSAVVIAEALQHPHKALKVEKSEDGAWVAGYISGKGEDVTPLARQGYEKAYFRANIIAMRREVIDELHSLSGSRVRPYIIAQERSLDIDYEADYIVAEQLLPYFNEDSGEFNFNVQK